MMRRRKRMTIVLSFGALFVLCIIVYNESSQNSMTQYNADKPIRKARALSFFDDKKNEKPSKMEILLDRGTEWAARSRVRKLSTLLENPVYERLTIKNKRTTSDGRVMKVKKKKVDVLLIISSGPRRSDRRQSIRETWWKQCVQTFQVLPECWFFTDLQKPGDKLYHNITHEHGKYGDMQLQPLTGGIEFGIRFLYHLLWAMTHYDFKYFVRVDDDYFLCLQRLLNELPISPPLANFHWGYTHCIQEMTRPEESLILLSRDLVETFLLQDPTKIQCHPWADQMMGVWVTELNILTLFRTDNRVHHAPIVDKASYLRYEKNVCNRRIAIHGTYPKDMRLFWEQRGKDNQNFTTEKERDHTIGNVMTNSEECELPHNFNFLLFGPEWQYEPQPCIYDPKWDTGKQNTIDGVYDGRQENKRLANQDLI